ncbi:MAG: hypothetical protein IT162_00735 [Bryobacterales bacterium]|nr:hypothetical protein [Bryobacterales bacterium]
MATPRYASPEQLRGEHAGIAADVFSLGVILAELLTGQWPFGDPGSRVAALRLSVEDIEPDIADQGDVGAILRKALHHAPASRYATVEALSADLSNYLGGFPIAARPASAFDRWRRLLRRNKLRVATGARWHWHWPLPPWSNSSPPTARPISGSPSNGC